MTIVRASLGEGTARLVLLDVGKGGSHDARIVLELAEGLIAAATEQAAYCACRVVVIYTKALTSRGSFADLTAALATGHHFGVLLGTDAIRPLTMARSELIFIQRTTCLVSGARGFDIGKVALLIAR